ncbi:MAG: ribokinase [Firmicutes bacterium]|nr:ribokinase [Bacillota bacterium]
MKMSKITIAGTLYIDYILPFELLPKAGETVVTDTMERVVGGKGANQAVMCRKLGAEAYLLGAVGNDTNGILALDTLQALDVKCDYVFRNPKEATGLSVIAVDHAGNNMILSYGGANNAFPLEALSRAQAAIFAADAILLHAEFPHEGGKFLVTWAREQGIPLFITPSPPQRVAELSLSGMYYLMPNQTEAEYLTGVHVDGVETAVIAGQKLAEQGVPVSVITLGDKGAFLTTQHPYAVTHMAPTQTIQIHVPPYEVHAVDTTAAGDAFCAAFASYLVGIGKAKAPNLEEISAATRFATAVGALTVSKRGAIPALPTITEIKQFLYRFGDAPILDNLW